MLKCCRLRQADGESMKVYHELIQRILDEGEEKGVLLAVAHTTLLRLAQLGGGGVSRCLASL